jgi:hypothetical protein
VSDPIPQETPKRVIHKPKRKGALMRHAVQGPPIPPGNITFPFRFPFQFVEPPA